MALQERLEAFEELLRLSRPRVEDDALSEARALLDRVGERRRLSMDHTVVALAGATGSGKSSLFNALCGLDLSVVGVRRPTTANAVACVWEPDGAQGLLDRLNVADRLRFVRRGFVEAYEPGRLGADHELAGLVLLDLPDHDSVESRHRAEVDRLVELVDVVVWVLDPEKYADASIHERYLRPLAGHADVMLVVLNQIDRLPEDAVPQCMADLRRLLDEGGLAVGEHGEEGTQVLAASALTGEGVDELRSVLGHVVREHGSANRRIRADLDRAARRLRPVYVGRGPSPSGLSVDARDHFLGRLGDAVGAPAAGETAERALLGWLARACEPPYVGLARAWRRRSGEPVGDRGTAATRYGGMPHGPEIAEAVSELASEASAGLPRAWARSVRQWAERGGWELVDELGRTMPAVHATGPDESYGEEGAPDAATSLVSGVGVAVAGAASAEGVGRHAAGPGGAGDAEQDGGALAARGAGSAPASVDDAVGVPRWVAVARVAQWVLCLIVLAGGIVLALAAAGVSGLPWEAAATALLGGMLAGPALFLGCRQAARGPAGRYGEYVEHRLRSMVEVRGEARVLVPVEAELRRYRAVRQRFGAAAGN